MSPDDDDDDVVDWDEDVGPPRVDYTYLVSRVLSDHGFDDVPDWAHRLLASQLRNMGSCVEPAIAERRQRERHKKLSSLRDKTDALLRELDELDALDRSGIDACIAGAASLAGEYPFGGERADAIIADIAKLRDALDDLTAIPPDPAKRGSPRTMRGDASRFMYGVLRHAGVTDVWKCSQIIVDILDGNVVDKEKRVKAMYDRLQRIPDSDK
jgi:hypothetical protein